MTPANPQWSSWREENERSLETYAGNHYRVWGLPTVAFRSRNTKPPGKWQRFLLRWFL